MDIYLLFIVILLVFIFTNKDSQENLTSVINVKKELKPNEFEIYIIHMKKNSDRMINFNKYYDISDLSFKKYNIFPAVVGKNINLIDYVSPNGYKQILETERTNSRRHHYDLTRGAVGCYLSHLSIYKKIVESNLDYGIVFEDDSIIANDFYARLQYGLSVVPDDWDIFLLGVICLKCDIDKDYININRFWGTHGYIIKKKSAEKLLEYLDKPLSKQIDADMSLLIKRKIIKVYAINPIIVSQDTKFFSDIQSNVIESDEAFNEEFKNQQLMKFYAKNKIENRNT